MAQNLESPVLVLNRHYSPVRITQARRALTMLYVGIARALDGDYEAHDFTSWRQLPAHDEHDAVGTSSGPLRVPRLLLLSRYGGVPQTTLRLSRRNVYLRDGYTCQYCGEQPSSRELNLDHVMPRSRGGSATWENLVTSCRRCNFSKGNATPEGAGMRLLRQPARPSWSLAATLAAAPRRFAEWEPFLGQRAVAGPS
jgi:5-methylcytosine-specific restriction endonuclease McrA